MTDTNKTGGGAAMGAAELLAALDKTHAWATEASDESRNEDGDGTREYDNDMRRFHEARAAVVALMNREAALIAERDALAERVKELETALARVIEKAETYVEALDECGVSYGKDYDKALLEKQRSREDMDRAIDAARTEARNG